MDRVRASAIGTSKDDVFTFLFRCSTEQTVRPMVRSLRHWLTR